MPVIGVARTDWDTDELREHVGHSVERAGSSTTASLPRLAAAARCVSGDYADPLTFERLAYAVHRHAGQGAFAVHYLAVPPGLFGAAADGLADVGLHEFARLVVEKPFGHDLDSARTLDALLRRHFADEQIFRVDHYLGKEPARTAGAPVRQHPARTDVEPPRGWSASRSRWPRTSTSPNRGSFYDAVGAVRDVVQNHLLQVLALMDAAAHRRRRRPARRQDGSCVSVVPWTRPLSCAGSTSATGTRPVSPRARRPRPTSR